MNGDYWLIFGAMVEFGSAQGRGGWIEWGVDYWFWVWGFGFEIGSGEYIFFLKSFQDKLLMLSWEFLMTGFL